MALDRIIARIEALKERERTAYARGFADGVAKRDEDVAADYEAGQQDACAQLLDLLPPVDNEPAQDSEAQQAAKTEAAAWLEPVRGTQTEAVLELIKQRAAKGQSTVWKDIRDAKVGNPGLLYRLRDRGAVEQDEAGAYHPAGYPPRSMKLLD